MESDDDIRFTDDVPPEMFAFYVSSVLAILRVEGHDLEPSCIVDEMGLFTTIVLERRNSIFAFDAKTDECLGMVLYEVGENTPFTPYSTSWWQVYGWIHVISVAPSARGRGLGKRLYEQVQAVMSERGITELQADVYDCNSISCSFHERVGFECYARVVDLERRRWQLNPLPDGYVLRGYEASDRGLLKEGLVAIYAAEGHASEFDNDAEQELECDEYLQLFRESTRVLVTPEGDCVGFVSATKTQRSPYGVAYPDYDFPYVFLDYIYTRDPGQQYGRLMLDHVERFAHSVGVDHIFSGFETCNERSARWHARQGFQHLVRIYRRPEAFSITDTASPFALLPRDILALIFSYLPRFQLLDARCVCKAWAETGALLITQLAWLPADDESMVKLFKAFPRVHELVLDENDRFEGLGKDLGGVTRALGEDVSRIISLALYFEPGLNSVADAALINLLTQFDNLRFITLEGFMPLLDEDSTVIMSNWISRHAFQLKRLTLGWQWKPAAYPPLQYLTHLSVMCSTELLLHLAEFAPRIRVFQPGISWERGDKDADAHELARLCFVNSHPHLVSVLCGKAFSDVPSNRKLMSLESLVSVGGSSALKSAIKLGFRPVKLTLDYQTTSVAHVDAIDCSRVECVCIAANASNGLELIIESKLAQTVRRVIFFQQYADCKNLVLLEKCRQLHIDELICHTISFPLLSAFGTHVKVFHFDSNAHKQKLEDVFEVLSRDCPCVEVIYFRWLERATIRSLLKVLRSSTLLPSLRLLHLPERKRDLKELPGLSRVCWDTAVRSRPHIRICFCHDRFCSDGM